MSATGVVAALEFEARDLGKRRRGGAGLSSLPDGSLVSVCGIGGENAEIAMKVPQDLTKVFQGILLFYVLACDSMIVYRIRLIGTSRKAVPGNA